MFRYQVLFVLTLLLGAPMERVNGQQGESIPFRQPLTHLASLTSAACPVSCFCSATTWNCDGGNLNAVPTGFPNTIMHINLVNNAITEIPAGVFSNFGILRTIDLRNNSITRVSAGAFSNLPVIQAIYLSFNKITYIETGSFVALDQIKVIRLDNNRISKLYSNTFTNLPGLEEIRLRHNPTLCCVEPKTFNRLPKLKEIQMYGTITNTTIFGTYDIGVAVSKTTFANGADSSNNLAIPGCPKLEYIELGTVKLHALYPNFFMSNKFLEMVRRIGSGYEVYSTDQEECDMLNRASMFTDSTGATICMVSPSNRLTDSPSRREKSHLDSYSRL